MGHAMADTAAPAEAGAEGGLPPAAADSEVNTSSWADEMVSIGPGAPHAQSGSVAAGHSGHRGVPRAPRAAHAARAAHTM